MAQNSNTQPPKSILKKPDKDKDKGSGSAESSDKPSTSKHPDHLKFDESNIKATYHPADKDYGFMKIDEPKTPYNDYIEPEEGTEGFQRQSSFVRNVPQGLDADLVSQKLLGISGGTGGSTANVTPEQTDEFKSKRKAHYQEFKVAKDLLKKGNTTEEEDEASEDVKKPGKADPPNKKTDPPSKKK